MNMKNLFLTAFAMLVSMTAYASDEGDNTTMSDMNIAETSVMLYYKDLEAPRKFYKGMLGLETTYEDDWVIIYQLNPGAAVGIVLEGGTAYHKAKEDNAVMLSLTVEDANAWYIALQSVADIKILKEIYDHPKAPIRAFLLEDPGGYVIEFFQWLK